MLHIHISPNLVFKKHPRVQSHLFCNLPAGDLTPQLQWSMPQTQHLLKEAKADNAATSKKLTMSCPHGGCWHYLDEGCWEHNDS